MPYFARSTPLCVIGSIDTKKNPLPHVLCKCNQYERVQTGRVVPAAVQCRIQYNRESTDNNTVLCSIMQYNVVQYSIMYSTTGKSLMALMTTLF